MKTFNEHIQGGKPVLVDFFATWCGPCQHMGPILHDVKKQTGDALTILKIDIDQSPAVASHYQVQAVPTLLLFQNGKIVWRKSGVVPANEIVSMAKQLHL